MGRRRCVKAVVARGVVRNASISEVPYIGTNRYQMLDYGQQLPRSPFAPSRLASRKRGEPACTCALSQSS